MKILHLDSGREMRGGQWQVYRLHKALLEQGHRSLLLARRSSPLYNLCRGEGLAVETLEPFGVGSRSRDFDLVHAHDARTHTLAAMLSAKPVVVARRVAFPVKKGFLSLWKYRRPRLFLAVSRHVAAQLQAAGVPDDRISVVYDGVPMPRRTAEGPNILVPYSDDPGKGMALAIEAAKRAGVHIEPSRNLDADLPTAQALVYLSESEGLGSGILLAMAHGVPVIGSNVGGIPELIQDGVNGVLTANDPDAVAAAFSRLDRQMGPAARQTVVERFTVEHMVRGTLTAYGRVLA